MYDHNDKVLAEVKHLVECKWTKAYHDSENDIHKLISGVGHDTPTCRAKDTDYNNLYQCCHYKREKK